MRTLELLAPAKNLETGIAAISHGADAVYIGAERFGARAAAGNSIDDIATVCSFAHQYRAKVFVTVNTLVRDDEKPAVEKLLRELCDIGVDAILFQDITVLGMFFDIVNERSEQGLPSPKAHASTQTDNRTADKVRTMHKMGCERIVLARELSIDEIAEIHRQCPDVELEVFVHGALCVSYSGLCYASERCFGRSANRGECAQVCRMKFSLLDDDDNILIKDRYLLSLKDMCQIDNLKDLIEAGAVSFKIEGRLKDVTYVKNVVAAYSQRLNDIIKRNPEKYCRASLGTMKYNFTPSLDKTFNRGYTTYFANGRHENISSPNTPKAIGEFVGKVKEIRSDRRGNIISFNVAGTATFSNGDGLCFINANGNLEGFRVNRVEGNRLFPLRVPQGLRASTPLYRNNDVSFEKQVMRNDSAIRTIPIRLHFSADDNILTLSAYLIGNDSKEDSTHLCTVTHQCELKMAQSPQHDNIVRQLTKLGGTIYSCDKVVMDNDFPYFIPSSVLSLLRHKLIENISLNTEHLSQNTPKSSLPAHHYSQNTEHYLMQCRFCLRHSLGFCTKHGGHKPEWREPLRLQLGDGKMFTLEFDCKNCQMNLLPYQERKNKKQ